METYSNAVSDPMPKRRKSKRDLLLQNAESVDKRKRRKTTSAETSCNSGPSMSNIQEVEKVVLHEHSIGQASYQRNKHGPTSTYLDFGDMAHVCTDCDALFWLNESKKRVSRKAAPIYTKCCQEGRIKLQTPHPTPPFLEKLLDPNNGPQSVLFRQNIRAYNSMFAFTSIGAKIDRTINDGSGPYVFKISGQVHHLMGTLLPSQDEPPKFAQLYVYAVKMKLQIEFKQLTVTEQIKISIQTLLKV
ncbi:hypothetical protein RchiOBHm_Chr5g0080791 [Rosa chinensis]|uniref:Helitron helicase-like domain-containing protein n=1 Tax=Rosa chinensis TaxID=74649 RepID=A0A2P6QMW8_ROSCH|nr:uncharacterized protein LOC112165337 [Rosa chinensis]PRQ35507.1 hypothetical protein RchiOBHm_Chr5g0080791 [Rosa chinensis]